MQISEAGNCWWEKQLDAVNLSFKDKSFKSRVITVMLWIWGLPVPPSPLPRKILREIRSLQQDEKTKSHPIQGSSVQAGCRHVAFFAVARLQPWCLPSPPLAPHQWLITFSWSIQVFTHFQWWKSLLSSVITYTGSAACFCIHVNIMLPGKPFSGVGCVL